MVSASHVTRVPDDSRILEKTIPDDSGLKAAVNSAPSELRVRTQLRVCTILLLGVHTYSDSFLGPLTSFMASVDHPMHRGAGRRVICETSLLGSQRKTPWVHPFLSPHFSFWIFKAFK